MCRRCTTRLLLVLLVAGGASLTGASQPPQTPDRAAAPADSARVVTSARSCDAGRGAPCDGGTPDCRRRGALGARRVGRPTQVRGEAAHVHDVD